MSVAREMMSAGPGCAVANGLLNSLETTKVKLQLHSSSAPVYSRPTTLGVMTQIAKEEGVVRGLMMPGLSASLTRSMLYGAYRVGLYASARDFLAGTMNGGGEPSLAHRIASGMFTGGLGSMLSCPLDVVRTRMQADSGLVGTDGRYTTGLRRGQSVRYQGMMDCFVSILRNEGLRAGLYRGSSVTVARASMMNGAQLASYDTLKRFLYWEEGPFLHLTCALASGIIAQTVVMPIDTIKSYMMLGNDWKAVWNIMKTNGPFWFYRGYMPACAGQGMIMVLQMPMIEQFRIMLGVAAI
mmetsp:Transcript_11434/g.21751  ORF Transcript_11434/g.21751 Transcript_11434/m.21751 type:complete len:297 (-) Transcript_11434:131-1021(-)